MGYFDGLANGNFLTDKDGNTVFFPWRGLARGRVLSDKNTEIELREFMSRYYKVTLIAAAGVGSFLDWAWLFLLLPISYIWLDLGTRSIVAGCPFSEERISRKDALANIVANFNKFTLWVLFTCSALFALAGILMTFSGQSPDHVASGVLVIAFFGGCAVIFWFMLKLKYA